MVELDDLTEGVTGSASRLFCFGFATFEMGLGFTPLEEAVATDLVKTVTGFGFTTFEMGLGLTPLEEGVTTDLAKDVTGFGFTTFEMG